MSGNVRDRRALAIPTRNKPSSPAEPFQSTIEKGAADGYAELDASGVVPDDQIPGTVARDADVNAAIAAHVALVDPHTQYERESQKNGAGGYAGLDGASKLTGSQQVYGIGANTACQGNDARLSDARTPTVHATSHDAGGSDAIRSEGTWTPVDNSGAGLVFAAASGSWEKNGRQVTVRGQVTYPVTASGAVASIGGLPFAVAAGVAGDVSAGFVTQTDEATLARMIAAGGGSVLSPRDNVDNTITNATLSGNYVRFCVIYRV